MGNPDRKIADRSAWAGWTKCSATEARISIATAACPRVTMPSDLQDEEIQ